MHAMLNHALFCHRRHRSGLPEPWTLIQVRHSMASACSAVATKDSVASGPVPPCLNQ